MKKIIIDEKIVYFKNYPVEKWLVYENHTDYI